jgi:hypothetical protein
MSRPSKKSDELVGKLEYAFSIGASIEEACFYADIHKDTYYEWTKKDQKLSDRFEALRHKPIFEARETVMKGVRRDPRIALDYLSRKKKDEFSTKVENDVRVKELPKPILGGLTQGKDGDAEESAE